jgi:hypothetical protein
LPDIDTTGNQFIASLVGSACIQYNIDFDTDEHLAHLVRSIPRLKKKMIPAGVTGQVQKASLMCQKDLFHCPKHNMLLPTLYYRHSMMF